MAPNTASAGNGKVAVSKTRGRGRRDASTLTALGINPTGVPAVESSPGKLNQCDQASNHRDDNSSSSMSIGTDECHSCSTEMMDTVEDDTIQFRGRDIIRRRDQMNRNRSSYRKTSHRQCSDNRYLYRQNGSKPCVLAPKLPPAQQRETVHVKTNIYPLLVENRSVYRYDVRMYTSRLGSQERIVDLCKGERDDSEITLRHRKCMLLMKRALELYRILSDHGAYLYDLSSTLFTNVPLNKELLPRLRIDSNKLSDELKHLIGCDVVIEITPCSEGAHIFNLAEFGTSVTADLARQDHSLRQFFEILTNNSALQNGTHYAFGRGKLFLVDGGKYNLEEQSLTEGRTLVTGVDKGIRFIDYSESVVPALVLDLKKAAFFDAVPLTDLAQKVIMPSSPPNTPIPPLDVKSFKIFSKKFGETIRDLRLEHIDCEQKSFVATGLTDLPIGELHIPLVAKGLPKISADEYYRKYRNIQIRLDWPAVRISTRKSSFFPIEVLRVAARQRVPISKQTRAQMKDAIKESALAPYARFRDISRNLQALDLDERTRFNPYLTAFGVRISSTPLVVEGHRREAPKVEYKDIRSGQGVIEIDSRNANWRMIGKEYLIAAEIQNWCILYDNDKDLDMVLAFRDALLRECRRKGIRFGEPVVECCIFENLEHYMEALRAHYPTARIFIMYVDSRDDTHDDLKLNEVLYQIVTQHIHVRRAREAPNKVATLENIINKLNCKNFGQCYAVVPESFATNRWISTGKTLIVGYDVCHPEPQSKHERRMKLPPSQPSVLGISFNGAPCAEAFIGDYAFQEPRKEQVTGLILENRIMWILDLFLSNRGVPPEIVVITRDGVSEGQFKMVMEEEVAAIRTGIIAFGRERLGVENYCPKIVCIIACKRHNKRFAVENGRTIENCLPLTVIDKDITRPDTTEFFMQSHKIIRGTGKLPAYSVPINEASLTMDEAQSLMMALCYTHQIVNQAISIPEPIYQADEWAKRGRNNFRAMMRRSGGRDTLPYLSNRNVDWDKITKKLAYMNSPLSLTRANA